VENVRQWTNQGAHMGANQTPNSIAQNSESVARRWAQPAARSLAIELLSIRFLECREFFFGGGLVVAVKIVTACNGMQGLWCKYKMAKELGELSVQLERFQVAHCDEWIESRAARESKAEERSRQEMLAMAEDRVQFVYLT